MVTQVLGPRLLLPSEWLNAAIYTLWCTTATITRYLGLNAAATAFALRLRRGTHARSCTNSDTAIYDANLCMATLTITTSLFAPSAVRVSRNTSTRFSIPHVVTAL